MEGTSTDHCCRLMLELRSAADPVDHRILELELVPGGGMALNLLKYSNILKILRWVCFIFPLITLFIFIFLRLVKDQTI